MHRPIRQLAAVVVAALLGGAVAAAVVTSTTHSKTTTTVIREVAAGKTVAATSQATPATTGSKSVNAVYRAASPGVVKIVVSEGGGSDFGFGGTQGQQKAQGSGWVYDKLGHIITNQHVVAGANQITVYFADGTSHTATLVASDPQTDLAVIKVNMPASLLHPLTLAQSDSLQVGDGVIAIGTPYGYQNSVSWGIVSALHRHMTAPSGFFENAIQTDAAINHGNSGGPLFNMSGNVVGITTQIQSDSGGNEGIGFAVPASVIRHIVSEILTTGRATHAFLGVTIQTVPPQVASAFNMAAGAEVGTVNPGTPAAAAGLHGAGTQQRSFQGDSYPVGGDVITAVDGKTVSGSNDLGNLIDSYKPGDKIQLTVVRNGQTRTVTVTLGTRPAKTTS